MPGQKAPHAVTLPCRFLVQGILASDLTLNQVKDLRVVQLLPPQRHSDARVTLQAQMHPNAEIRLSGQVACLPLFCHLCLFAAVCQPANRLHAACCTVLRSCDVLYEVAPVVA